MSTDDDMHVADFVLWTTSLRGVSARFQAFRRILAPPTQKFFARYRGPQIQININIGPQNDLAARDVICADLQNAYH